MSDFSHSASCFQGSSCFGVSELPSLLWPDNIPLHGHTAFRLSVHPLMDIGLFPSPSFCKKQNVAGNISGQVSIGVPVFNPFGHITKSGIARSYGNSVLYLLRNLFYNLLNM